jgi:serine/threonine protein phosphatase 1
MSKWRPSKKNCLYVIGDIHGGLDPLKKICDRILPLRKSDGGKDLLIFLGDYIDRHIDSHKVIDFLIELEKKYGSQVVFLKGNHELMLLQALNIQPGKNMTLQQMSSAYKMWMANGGRETIYGYKYRKGILDDSWDDYPRNKVLDLIPKDHIDFFTKSLVSTYELEDYIFVHGGLNPQEPVSSQDLEVLVWDRSLLKFVQNAIQRSSTPILPWDKTIICGHSVQSDKKPVITDKFMMLDCGGPLQLLVVELRSKTGFMAKSFQDRMVKLELKSTKKVPGMFRRVQ